MSLTRGVAIVDQAYVETITHEVGLDDLDDPEGVSATLAGAMLRATDLIIIDLIARDRIDPSTISNEVDLKPAAAWLSAWIVLDAQRSEEYTTRAARCRKGYDEQIAKYRFVSNVADDKLAIRDTKGLPRVIQPDACGRPGMTREGRERRFRRLGW